MEKYNVIFMKSALEDLEEIILYIAKDSKDSAIKFHDKIMDKSKALETFHKLGLLVPDNKIGNSGFRVIIIDKYLMFYKIYEKEIIILRILHGSRDYPQLFSRI